MQYAKDIEDLSSKRLAMATADGLIWLIGYSMIAYKYGLYNAIAISLILSSVEIGAIRGSIHVGELLNRAMKRVDEKPRGYENKL